MEIALHDVLFVVPIVCACPVAWGVGNGAILISVKTGLFLWLWANVVVALRVEVAFHDILLVVPIVCVCPTAWGIRNLHQTAAVEEEPCPSAVFFSHTVASVVSNPQSMGIK